MYFYLDQMKIDFVNLGGSVAAIYQNIDFEEQRFIAYVYIFTFAAPRFEIVASL